MPLHQALYGFESINSASVVSSNIGGNGGEQPNNAEGHDGNGGQPLPVENGPRLAQDTQGPERAQGEGRRAHFIYRPLVAVKLIVHTVCQAAKHMIDFLQRAIQFLWSALSFLSVLVAGMFRTLWAGANTSE
ncbi:hypothetical protein FRC09_000746 [Ceratobasidium sp. 395]|nr:hypothetical protein FRC09_000746 [Ceratobasidium sp. 395]